MSLPALSRGVTASLRNPVVFVPPLVVALLAAVPLAVRPTAPGLSNLFVLCLCLAAVPGLPFVRGGLVGMAGEALTGDTTARTFGRAGRGSYGSLLALSVGLATLGVLTAAVTLLVAGAAVVANYPGGATGTAGFTALLVAVLVAVVVTYLLVRVCTAFVTHAAVLEDRGARGSLRRSLGLVRANPAAVLGYTAVVAVLWTPVLVMWWLAARGTGTASLLGAVLVGTLVGGVHAPLSTAFYRGLIRA